MPSAAAKGLLKLASYLGVFALMQELLSSAPRWWDRITAAQLLNRSHWVRLRPWPSHDEAGHIHEDWLRLIAHVSEYVALPRGPKQNRLHTRAAIDYLVSGVDGRPGTAIEWLLRAAAWAATNDKPLDRSALVATKPGAR